MKLRAAIRRFFLHCLLLLAVLTGVAIWRPEWRIAAQRWAAPSIERAAAPVMERGAALLERAAQPLRERAGAWRREIGTPPATKRPRPEGTATSEPERSPDTRSHEP